MSYDEVNSSIRGRSQLSSTQKKEILWNIIEPGDPYDIKKSMIAKLPGDQRNFMGDHLELVCLLQAAQIQRLCQYLEEYKLRYREIERRELDRHSYEIQIKELTLKLEDYGNLGQENQKLRDFLRKQTTQFEQLRKKATTDDGVTRKYEDALKQVQILIQENTSLKSEKNSLTIEVQQLNARISALESTKVRQLEDLKYTLTTQTNANYEREKQELSFKFQTEINRLDFEVRRLKDINDTKNREIEELQLRSRRVQSQLDEEVNKNAHFGSLQSTISEYQAKFGVLSKQIERLNFVLRNKANQCEQQAAKLRQFEDQMIRRTHEIEQYNERIRRYDIRITEITTINNELNGKVRQLGETQIVTKRYEQKIEQLSLQIQRLNGVLKKKVSQISEFQARVGDMEYELKKVDLVKRQNQELKRFVIENSELKRKIAELENKVPLLSNEIQRLNGVIRSKMEQLNSWQQKCRNYERQMQNQKGRIDGYEREISTNWKSRITMIEQQNSNYQRENQDLRRRLQNQGELNRRLTQYENRIAMMSQEIQRLNEVIRGVRSENEDYRRRLLEAGELTRRNSQYEARISSLMAENQQISNTARNQLGQFDSRFRDCQVEIERLNIQLKIKTDEQVQYENKIRSMMQENQLAKRGQGQIEFKYGQQLQSKITAYQTLYRQYTKEGEQNSRKFSEYQSRLTMVSQEVERLNSIIKVKTQQNTNLDSKYRNLQLELENSRRQIAVEVQGQIGNYQSMLKKVGQENQDYKRKIQEFQVIGRKTAQYENKFVLMTQEFERLNSVLRSKTEEFSILEGRYRSCQQELDNAKKGIGQYEFRITQITQEMQTRITNYQTRILQITHENEDGRRRLQQLSQGNRKLADYQNRIALLTQQLQRLNLLLRTKSQQSSTTQSRYRSVQQELQTTRKSLTQYQYRFNQINQQLQSRITMYQTKIKQSGQENQQYRRKIQELADGNRKIAQYEKEIWRLNDVYTNLESRYRKAVQEADSLKKIQTENQQKFTQINQQFQSRNSTFELKIKQISQENEEYRRRLQQLGESNRRLSEYENKIMLMGQELQRLNGTLRIKVEEAGASENRFRALQSEYENVKRGVGEYEFKLTQISQEFQKKISTYDIQLKRASQENEEMRRRLQEFGDISRKIGEYQARIAQLAHELERVNGVLKSKVEENFSLDSRLRSSIMEIENYKRVQSQIQVKYGQQFQSKISIYESKIKKGEQDTEELLRKVRELSDSNRKIGQYESRILMLSQQLERVNNGLKSKVDEVAILDNRLRSSQLENENLRKSQGDFELRFNQQFKSKIKTYESRIKQSDSEIDELRRRLHQLSDANRKLSEYEARFALLSQEIERLNGGLRAKVEENSILENRVRSMTQELESYRRGVMEIQYKVKQYADTNEELNKKLLQLSQVNRKIPEYENRIRLLTQQLQRINLNLSSKLEQLRITQQQNQNLKRSQNHIQNQLSSQLQNQINIYETKAKKTEAENIQLTRKIMEYAAKMTSTGQEIQRLNFILKSQGQEFSGVQNKYRATVQGVGRENQELRRRLQDLADVNRKVGEYENRIVILSQEIERLNGTLKLKIEEYSTLQNRFRTLQQQHESIRRTTTQAQYKISHLAQQHQLKLTTYQTRIKQVSQQNEQLRRNLQELSNVSRKIGEYENKLAILGQELERVNQSLRIKAEENGNLENVVRGLQQENQKIRKNMGEIQFKFGQEFQVQVSNYELKLKQSYQELEETRRRLNELSDVNRKVSDYENKIAGLISEIERLNGILKIKVQQNSAYEGRLRSSQIQIDNFRRTIGEYEFKVTQLSSSNIKLAEYENRLAVLSQEIERLNGMLKMKVEEMSISENRYRSVQQELDGAKRIINEFEFKLNQERQANEEARARLQGAAEINRKISEYQNKIMLLSQEIERLNGIIRSKSEENSSTETRFRSLASEYEFKMTQISQQFQMKITTYETKLKQAGSDNQDLRRKLQSHSESVMSEYETKFAMLSQQIQRLNGALKATSDELEEFRRKDYTLLQEIERLNNTLRLKVQESSRYESIHTELSNRIKILEQHNNQIVSEYNSLRNTNSMLSSQYQNSKKHLLECQQSIQKLCAQFERLQTIMQNLKKQNYNLKVELKESQTLQEKHRVLSAEIDRLTQIIEGQKLEISELRIRFADEAALHKRINQHLALMVVLFAEIEALRQRVKDKEKEVEDVRRSSLAPFKI